MIDNLDPVDATLGEVEAATLLGVSRGTLARLRRMGTGPRHYRPGPHMVRYARRDIESWQLARTFGGDHA